MLFFWLARSRLRSTRSGRCRQAISSRRLLDKAFRGRVSVAADLVDFCGASFRADRRSVRPPVSVPRIPPPLALCLHSCNALREWSIHRACLEGRTLTHCVLCGHGRSGSRGPLSQDTLRFQRLSRLTIRPNRSAARDIVPAMLWRRLPWGEHRIAVLNDCQVRSET